MNKTDFIRTVQQFTAVSAVGVSAMRGQGKGVMKTAQKTLGQLNLTQLKAIATQAQYEAWLDQQTEQLLNRFPIRNRPWGAARKALNLFLRDCLYNKYLCAAYKMGKVERWLEIPLDSYISKELQSKASQTLPRWPGLKHLKKPTSALYQDVATSWSKERGVSRIHLDVELWLKNRND